jgi:hypothetical protein
VRDRINAAAPPPTLFLDAWRHRKCHLRNSGGLDAGQHVNKESTRLPSVLCPRKSLWPSRTRNSSKKDLCSGGILGACLLFLCERDESTCWHVLRRLQSPSLGAAGTENVLPISNFRMVSRYRRPWSCSTTTFGMPLPCKRLILLEWFF